MLHRGQRDNIIDASLARQIQFNCVSLTRSLPPSLSLLISLINLKVILSLGIFRVAMAAENGNENSNFVSHSSIRFSRNECFINQVKLCPFCPLHL